MIPAVQAGGGGEQEVNYRCSHLAEMTKAHASGEAEGQVTGLGGQSRGFEGYSTDCTIVGPELKCSNTDEATITKSIVFLKITNILNHILLRLDCSQILKHYENHFCLKCVSYKDNIMQTSNMVKQTFKNQVQYSNKHQFQDVTTEYTGATHCEHHEQRFVSLSVLMWHKSFHKRLHDFYLV